MIDKILKMYVDETNFLASMMQEKRKNSDFESTYEYTILSAKWRELNELFNKTIAIINEECAK